MVLIKFEFSTIIDYTDSQKLAVEVTWSPTCMEKLGVNISIVEHELSIKVSFSHKLLPYEYYLLFDDKLLVL